MNRSILLSLLFIAAFTLFCNLGRSVPVWAHAGHAHEDGPTLALPDVLAQVNGVDIRREAIWEDLKRSLKRIKGRGLPLTGDQEKRAARQLLDEEIDRNLLLQKAESLGLSVPDAAIERRVSEVKSKFTSEKSFLQRLQQRNLTLESYREELRREMLAEAVLQQEVGSGVKATDAELKAHFDAHPDRFLRKEQRRASVILIKVPEGNLARETKARATLDKILSKLEEGRDFAGLAREFSQDSLAKRGGDLGYLTEDHMYGQFAEKAFKMKVGEVSGVFRSPHGLHLLMLTDIKGGSTGDFEGDRENVLKDYVRQEIEKRKKPYLEALRRQARVKLYF